jgi:hypothetical protein
MSTINLASHGLWIGAIGQFWFYHRPLSDFPQELVWSFLLLPWFTVFAISFFKRPPIGRRSFRLCLVSVMVWYTLVTLIAEVIQYFLHLPADGHFPIVAARILMYFGFLSFVVFIPFCVAVRKYEVQKEP